MTRHSSYSWDAIGSWPLGQETLLNAVQYGLWQRKAQGTRGYRMSHPSWGGDGGTSRKVSQENATFGLCAKEWVDHQSGGERAGGRCGAGEQQGTAWKGYAHTHSNTFQEGKLSRSEKEMSMWLKISLLLLQVSQEESLYWCSGKKQSCVWGWRGHSKKGCEKSPSFFDIVLHCHVFSSLDGSQGT